MKVCIVSRGDLSLFPATQGASVKLFSTIKFLSLLGVKVFFVTAENDFYFEIVRGKFRKKKYPFFLAKSPVTKRIKKLLSFLGLPPDIFVLYHPLLNFKLWFKTLYVVVRERVNIIQAEFTAFSIPALFAKIFTFRPVILVEHNVESFQLPKITNLTRRGKRVVRTVERLAGTFANRVVTMNEEEKRRVKVLGIKDKKIRIIPHGVDLNLYRKANPRKIKKKYRLKFPTLIFHGVYSYKPNRDAIKILAKKFLPDLRKKGLRVKVLAVGDFPPKDISDPDIIFTGVVKNLADYITAADIAVVPLQAGGGMRMKILEYFAAGKPVISTKKGAEGIPAKNGREIIIAEIREFPDEIIKLVRSRRLRKKLGKNAKKFVNAYSWRNICKKYIEVYKEVLD